MPFTESDVPRLAGKRAIVTGATGGLGLETARMLAAAGAFTVLAGRDERKGRQALGTIRRRVPNARISFQRLDLASLQSIQIFAEAIGPDPVDLLINNAGVMAPPNRLLTKDGFELQFGTNHLGHFALTGRLLSLLTKAEAPRVVVLSSGIAAFGRIDFDDLQSEHPYAPNAAYMQSKLANLLFVRSLHARSLQHGWNILPVAAHPGHARTDLITNGAGQPQGAKRLLIRMLQAVASQDAASGALPTLLAATGQDVQALDYFGPTGFLHQKGPAGKLIMPRNSQDDSVAERLWARSQDLTGVEFRI